MTLALGGRFRKGISVAAAVAVVCAVTVAGGAVYLNPLISGANKTMTITAGTNHPLMNNVTTYSVSYANTSYSAITSCSTTAFTTGQTGWQEWAVANATLRYFKTQMYIHNAWNYTFSIVETKNPGYEIFGSNHITALNLNLSGTWTSGYTLSFTRTVLNVTVQYEPTNGCYQVVFFNTQGGGVIRQSIQFNSTQQRAISNALADSKVKSDLSDFPYFVYSAEPEVPRPNGSLVGDYAVSFYQPNGPKGLYTIVNLNSRTVVATYMDGRGSTGSCYPMGVGKVPLCFSSPWGAP